MIYLDNQSVNVVGDGIRKGLRNREQQLHMTHFELKMSVTIKQEVKEIAGEATTIGLP